MVLYYVKVVMIKVGRSVSWSDPISGLGSTTSRLRDMKSFFFWHSWLGVREGFL